MGEMEVLNSAAVETALVEGTELPMDESPEAAARAIVEQILASPDVDSVFSTFAATPISDLLGIPLEVRGVKWNRSSFDNGAPVFAVVNAVRLDSGEAVTATCGGRSVMAAFYAFGRMNAYPVRLAVIESPNPTKEGYRPYRIVRVPDENGDGDG